MTPMVALPRYLEQFSCIGPDCEDTCCVGWQVPVDIDTFDRYQGVSDPELSPMFRELVVRNESAGPYARITLNENGRCPFLASDDLCSIQKKLGEPFLSITCTSYPRVEVEADARRMWAAMLSCPEAARLALLASDAMVISNREVSKQQRINSRSIDVEGSESDGPAHQFHAVRDLAIGLLGRRDVSLESRLVALGFALRRLSDEESLSEVGVKAAKNHYQGQLAVLEDYLGGIKPQRRILVKVLRDLTREQVEIMAYNTRYLSALRRMAEGLGLDRSFSDEIILERYEKALRDYLLPYLAIRPYVLENYLINQIYTTIFPFTPERTQFEDFVLLVIRYALIKLHLVGVASLEHRMDDKLVIETIQPFQKAVEHNAKYLPHVLDLLRENDLASMGYMAILIVS